MKREHSQTIKKTNILKINESNNVSANNEDENEMKKLVSDIGKLL